MTDRLRRHLADRNRILVALSHDLRTPIAALRLRAELVEDTELQARLLLSISEMERMAESATAYLRDNKAEEPRPVDLGALISAIVEDQRDLGRSVQWTGEIPRCIADVRPGVVRRIVANLLDNAIEHGGGLIEISLGREGDAWVIAIADRGPGVPDTEIERLFEPFARIDPARQGGHSGLGLTIARDGARAHGGEVMLARRAGGGLTAKLHLPARQAQPN